MSDWIVVVDDEALSLINAKNMLHEVGMRVSCVRSGREFLAFMEKNGPDLVLLDIMMRDMDGFEVYRKLRELERQEGRKEIPVIFLTGEDDVEVEKKGLEIGASDFVRKPFNRDILVKRISNALASFRRIEDLAEEAKVDALTGFLNKAAGTEKMKEVCAEKTGAFAVLDLDSFKLVNDLYGHEMGDQVLRAFAEVAKKTVREREILCRIGGDEFSAFFCSAEDAVAVQAIVKRLNEGLLARAKELMGEDFSVPLGISVGAVMVPEYGREHRELFALADKMLYQVKQNGKHGCAVYEPSVETGEPEGEDLEKEMGKLTQIIEERNESSGALMLGIETFASIYRFLTRYMKRYGMVALKVFVSLDVKDWTEGGKEQELEEISEQFGIVLQKALRKSDMILKHKKNQFYLLLPALLEQHAPSVKARIQKEWEKTGYQDRVKIQSVVEVLDYRK